MWALLTLYQALRAVLVEAAESISGTDPDCCCFTIALQTARDQVVQAVGILPDEPGPVGLSTRKVKSPMSRYSDRRDGGRPDHSHTITHLAATVIEPDPDQPPLPTLSHDAGMPLRRRTRTGA